MSRKKAAIIIIGVMAAFIGIISLVMFLSQSDENQFGKFIRIQNYDQKIKNLSSDMRDAMESNLYTVVSKNTDDSTDAASVKDAFIRDNSNEQSYSPRTTVFDGTFIVDMESIKQSYRVQYSYSRENTIDVGGYQVVISCLPVEELKYGEFTCTDLVSEQATNNDMILQYLPYENFSFKLSPDATQGEKLVLVATLDIPQVDLKGNAESNAQVIALYKNEVFDWIKSKGADPTKYEVQFNYDDAGNLIVQHDHSHGD